MKRSTVVTFALLCSTLAWADQVVMKNGDRVTGKVVKKTGKDLTIKSDQFGLITTSWDQVASISVEQPVTVVLQDGRTVNGTLTTRDGTIGLTSAGTQSTIQPTDVTAIRDPAEQQAYERLLHPGWGQLWTGTGTIGFAGTAGNAKTLTFTAGVNAVRVTNTDKTSVYFNSIKASALVNGKTADTAQAVRGGLAYDHNISPRLFVDVFNDYEYDRFQALDLRFVIGGGLGFHAWKTDRSTLDVLGGGDFNRSSFSTPLLREVGEFYWGDEYSMKMSAATSLVQSFRMFDDPAATGAFRINFDVGASTRIMKWLSWNVSLSDRYLNNPAPGRKTNDFLYTTGLGITFAR